MLGFMKNSCVVALFCLVLGFWPAVGVAQDTPCADMEKQILALKQEIAKLQDANVMLLENLVNCGQEVENLRDKIESLENKQNEKQN